MKQSIIYKSGFPDLEQSMKVLKISCDLHDVSDKTLFGSCILNALRVNQPIKTIIREIQEQAKDNRQMVSEVVGEELLKEIESVLTTFYIYWFMENSERLIEICEQIAEDVKNDAKEFDGKPFDGKTVAQYFGYHGAAINALASILKEIILHQNKTQTT